MDSIAIGSAGLCEAGTDLAGGLARLGSVEIGSAGQDLAELGWDDLARISCALCSSGFAWNELRWGLLKSAELNWDQHRSFQLNWA